MKEETLKKLIRNELERNKIINEELLESIIRILNIYVEDSKVGSNKNIDRYLKDFKIKDESIFSPNSYSQKDYESCSCNPKNGGSGICNCVRDSGIRYSVEHPNVGPQVRYNDESEKLIPIVAKKLAYQSYGSKHTIVNSVLSKISSR